MIIYNNAITRFNCTLIVIFFITTLHAESPIVNIVTDNKTLLTQQIADLKSIKNQLAATGITLKNELLGTISATNNQLAEYEQLLAKPQAIFNDPFKELAEKNPTDQFLVFIRNPQFKASYSNLWSNILSPLGAQSVPDIFNSFVDLLNLISTKLAAITSEFSPIAADLDQISDPQNIYYGLDGAIKDFEHALSEIHKLEKLLAVLGL